jgi:hypothetical protein
MNITNQDDDVPEIALDTEAAVEIAFSIALDRPAGGHDHLRGEPPVD